MSTYSKICISLKNQKLDIEGRKCLTWKMYGKHEYILSSTISKMFKKENLKRALLPFLSNEAGILTLNTKKNTFNVKENENYNVGKYFKEKNTLSDEINEQELEI